MAAATTPTAMPLVSVLIPAFNHERFVRRCLDSVLEDPYPAKELVIIDDYYDGLLVVTFVHRPTLGNETQKISPGSPGNAQRRPP